MSKESVGAEKTDQQTKQPETRPNCQSSPTLLRDIQELFLETELSDNLEPHAEHHEIVLEIAAQAVSLQCLDQFLMALRKLPTRISPKSPALHATVSQLRTCAP